MTVIHGVRSATGGDVSAREVRNETLHWSARLGLSARASIYLLIGFLAVLVATGHSTKETDQWGAFQQLNREHLRAHRPVDPGDRAGRLLAVALQ